MSDAPVVRYQCGALGCAAAIATMPCRSARGDKATMEQAIEWPRKTRELHNHHFDSTVWNEFKFRPDDVVVATYAKSGTTWVQHIVGQLVFCGSADVSVADL